MTSHPNTQVAAMRATRRALEFRERAAQHTAAEKFFWDEATFLRNTPAELNCMLAAMREHADATLALFHAALAEAEK